MLAVADLRATSRDRLRDARVLLQSKRFAGAAYLSGYAVEMALKARICATLGWTGFPEKGKEFEGLQSLKTHDLEILRRFSGVDSSTWAQYLPEWSVILEWDPQRRYSRRPYTDQRARDMVAAASRLVKML